VSSAQADPRAAAADVRKPGTHDLAGLSGVRRRSMNGRWILVALGLGAALLPVGVGPLRAELADSRWPMFHGDLRHTGQSSVNGPATATVKWTWLSSDIIRGSPTIATDGTVYVAAGYAFCAIDPDGSQRWCTPLSGEATLSAAAIDADGTVYYGARDNRLYAFNPDGSIKWRYLIHNDGDIRTSPAVAADGTVYFSGTWAGLVHALNPSGTLKWRFKVGQGILWSSPAVNPDTGIIYIGSTNGALHALTPAGLPVWGLKGIKLQGLNRNSSPAIGDDGTIYVGTMAGVYGVGPNGTVRWFFPTKGHVEATPAIANDGAIYVGTTTGRTFYKLSSNGKQIWKIAGTDAFPTSAALGADGIVYVSMGATVLALHPDGSELWRYTTGDYINSSPAIGADGTLYLGSSDHHLYAFGP
jgi:outer membrane protein assembly factor BamB